MINAGDIRKGMVLKLDGGLHRVQSNQYYNPGRGAATMTVSLEDLSTGSVNKRVFYADDKVEDVFVEAEDSEYLYRDGDILHFMNLSTYDQYEVSADLFGDDVNYLKENMQIQLRLYNGRVIDYVLPTKMTYRVVEAEVAIVGNSAGSVTKRVKVESGASIVVPIFINEGDLIEVDTRDGSYVGRG
jgi:elongation factor P